MRTRWLTAVLAGSACTLSFGGCSSGADTQRSDSWLSERADGTRLEVVTYIGSGSCNDFDRVDVEESAEEVLIYAYITGEDGKTACTDDYTWETTEVELDEPLGDRSLSGCVAPADAHRAPDLPHDSTPCEDLVRPDYAGTVTGDYPDE